MKAAVFRQYGPPEVVRVEELREPAPKANEILVRVCASAVNAADWRVRKADPGFVRLIFGLSRPKKGKVLGMDFSGTVEAVGPAVTRFAPGDEVFGSTGAALGAHAQYLCIAETASVGLRPCNIPLEDCAAILFGGFSALHFLRKAGVGPGQEVLVYGASGSVGVFAVQLASHLGARVTGVCSTANLELVRSLGAEAVIDYTREDFSASGRRYDVVFDAVGKADPGRRLRALKHGGWLLDIGGERILPTLGEIRATLTGVAKRYWGGAAPQPQDIDFLKGMIEAGELRTVIERRFPLAEIVEAHRLAESGRKKGHALVLME